MVALEDLREHVMESCNLREDTETLRTWYLRCPLPTLQPSLPACPSPNVWVKCLSACVAQTYAHTRIPAYPHTRIPAYTHTRIHTCTHTTYTQVSEREHATD